MSDLLRSPKGKVGAATAVGLLLILAVWFLLVSPQRAKANDLTAQVSTSRAELAQRKLALASPSTNVTVKPSDVYRLSKALPNGTDMAGILLDVNRIAGQNQLKFQSLTTSAQVSGTGYLEQPLVVIVQGRFSNFSRFLGDIRSLVLVRGQRLDARGRLYSVSTINITAPDSPNTFPVVKATLTLNAYSFTAPPPATTPAPSTTTDTSSSGTVAAGANP